MESFDVVVVGLGVMGSASLWQASKRGSKCLGVEQFSVPHARGSSHGATRIIRSLYPQPHFSKMVNRAWSLWEELETEAETELIVKTGGVDFAPRKSANIKNLISTCESNRIPYEMLNPQETSERYPGLQIPDDFCTVATKKAGIIKASKSTLVMQMQAIKFGAKIRDETKLIGVEDKKGTVVITLEEQSIGRNARSYKIQCKKLIVSPGAWLTPLMKNLFDISVNSSILQMGYYYFETQGADKSVYHASKFPVFVDYSGDTQHIYGTPAYEYPSLLKVGSHGDGFQSSKTTANERTFKVIPELLEFAQQRVKTFFPLVNWRNPVHSETCLYTWTRNAQFLLDFLPSNPNIIVGGGGSGHAFKHGSVIGEILADMAIDGSSTWNDEISEFSFAYHTTNPKL